LRLGLPIRQTLIPFQLNPDNIFLTYLALRNFLINLKTKLSLVAAASLTFLSAQSQAQGVNVYGRMVMSANQVETGTTSKVNELRDNASRLGFRVVLTLSSSTAGMFN
jgi:hypothetical protein